MTNPDTQSPENILTPEQLEALRQQLKALTFPKPRQKSFLELIDLHRLESVSSKILSHFLDSQADHGLGSLPLIALMQAAGIKSRRKPETQQVYVELECKTADQKGRLDLVLELTDQLIVIENKIHHKANNPFPLYIKHCKKEFKHHEKQTYILMGLHQPNPMPKDFVFVSHYEFGNTLRQLIKQHDDEQLNGHRYSAFLMDYLEGIDSMNPKKFTDQHQHVVEFVQDHLDELNQLQAQQKILSDYTKMQLAQTIGQLPEGYFGDDKIVLHRLKDMPWDVGHSQHSSVMKLQGIKYHCYLVAHWYLSEVCISLAMYKPRSGYSWVDTEEVVSLLKTLGIKTINQEDSEVAILYTKPAKGMTPERFAKEIDKQYQRLINACQ